MNAGDTVYIPLPKTSLDTHLWIVISDPAQSDHILLVNFTSLRVDKDQACVIRVGDHPFVNHDTLVNYRDAKLCKAAELETLVNGGHLRKHGPVSAELLERIRKGAVESWMKLDHVQILIDQGLVCI